MSRTRFALPAALFATLFTTPVFADDAWFGRDKALHFAASALVAGSAYGVSSLAIEDRTGRSIVGASFGVAAGASKELYDLAGYGDPSWRDFTWDVLGTAFGVGVALVIDVAVRGARHDDTSAPTSTALTRSRGVLLRW